MAKKKQPVDTYPKVFETFKTLGMYERREFDRWEPSVINGVVRFRKYRVTIEEIEEPVEVLQERLIKMWEECDNMHHMDSLQKAAKSIGFELDYATRGKNRKVNLY